MASYWPYCAACAKHTMKEVPRPLPDLQSGGLQEPEVSFRRSLVLEEAGLASLCLQMPLEIMLTVIEWYFIHVLSPQPRGSASVWQVASTASCAML